MGEDRALTRRHVTQLEVGMTDFNNALAEMRGLAEGTDLQSLYDQWDSAPNNKAKTRKAYNAFVKAGHAPALPTIPDIKSGKAWSKKGAVYVLPLNGTTYSISGRALKSSGEIELVLVKTLDASGHQEVLSSERTMDKGQLQAIKARMYGEVAEYLKHNMHYDGGVDIMSDWLTSYHGFF